MREQRWIINEILQKTTLSLVMNLHISEKSCNFVGEKEIVLIKKCQKLHQLGAELEIKTQDK